MSQSRRKSIFEAVANMVIGFILSLLTGYLAYPLLGLHVNGDQNFEIVIVFTFVSFARSYALRRIFNRFK